VLSQAATVKENDFQRIGVTDRTQAALWAKRNGLRRKPR